VFLLAAFIGLIIGVESSLGDKSSGNEYLEKTLIAIFSILASFVCLFMIFLVWTNFFSKRVEDIEFFCKQTEIAQHGEIPETIFKSFMQQEEMKKYSQKLQNAQILSQKF